MKTSQYPSIRIGNFTVLYLSEGMASYENMANLREHLEKMMQSGSIHIALNLNSIDIIHSFFIKVIAITHKKLKLKNGQLCIIGATPFVIDLMHILTLDAYIPLYKNEKDFIATVPTGKNTEQDEISA